jgi:hypothetical protein
MRAILEGLRFLAVCCLIAGGATMLLVDYLSPQARAGVWNTEEYNACHKPGAGTYVSVGGNWVMCIRRA